MKTCSVILLLLIASPSIVALLSGHHEYIPYSVFLAVYLLPAVVSLAFIQTEQRLKFGIRLIALVLGTLIVVYLINHLLNSMVTTIILGLPWYILLYLAIKRFRARKKVKQEPIIANFIRDKLQGMFEK